MAQLNLFPPPFPSITPIGVFVHLFQISNTVTNSGTWTPSDVTLIEPLPSSAGIDTSIYDRLDWSKIPLDKQDEEVQEIINPNPEKIQQKIIDAVAVTDLEKSQATQLNTVKSEIIETAVEEQGLNIVEEEVTNIYDENKIETYTKLTFDKLLRKAGDLAKKLGKDPNVKYENLKQSYIQGIHGLCPQGTQAVLAALTGVEQLGKISGHADWFSFKSPGTYTKLTGQSSFAIDVDGIVYYNDRVNIDEEWSLDPTKWQIGDVLAQGYTKSSGAPYGHIQIWTGWNWMSDFKQNRVQAKNVDWSTVALWRLNENGINAIRETWGDNLPRVVRKDIPRI